MDEEQTLEPAPTLQPALPVIGVFGDSPEVPPVVHKTGVYVDGEGFQHDCEIVFERPNGSVDIRLGQGLTAYRRDCIRRQAEGQTGDYLK